MIINYLIIIATTFLILCIVLFLSLISLRTVRVIKSRRADTIIEKNTHLLTDLTGENVSLTDDIVKKLKSIGDIRVTEILVDRAASLMGGPSSHFRDLYDATGITQGYINILKTSKSWKKRAFAAEKLGQIGSAQSVPFLLSTIRETKDEDEDVRGAALRALARIKNERAIPFLIEALGYPETWLPPRISEILVSIGEKSIVFLIKELKNNPSESIRMWSAEILGWLGAKESLDTLMRSLSDISPEVRAKAAGALGKIKDDRAVFRLLELLLSDPVPFVRIRVSQALGSIGHPAVIDYLINVLKDPEWWVRVRAVEALEKLGEKAVSALLVALEDEDMEVRKRAAMALERIGYVEKILEEYGQVTFRHELRKVLFLVVQAGVLESISQKLMTAEENLKKRIVRILGDAEVKEAAEPLLELLAHTTEWSLKSRIIEGLGKIGAKEAIPHIIEHLKDSEEWVRKATVEALGKLEAQDIADDIATMLDDPSPIARESALKALLRLRISRHNEKIENLLFDPVPRVRSTALGVIRESGFSIGREQVSRLLTDISEEVLIGTVRYCSEKQETGVYLDIVRLLSIGSDALKQEVVNYIGKTKSIGLQEILSIFDINKLSRETIAYLLEAASLVKGKEAYQFIIGYTEDGDSFLRGKAYHELSQFGIEGNEKIFERGLFDPFGEVRQIVLTGIASDPRKKLLEKAQTLSSDPDEHVRVALALTLGKSRLKEFKPLVINMLDDASIKVVASALIGIASFDDPVLLEIIYSKRNIRQIRDQIKNITKDSRFKSVIELIRKRAETSHNLEVELVLTKDERRFAQDLIKTIRESPLSEVRMKAMDILKIIATGELFTTVLGIMKRDPLAELRNRAMEVLVSIGREDDVVSAISTMLVDPAPTVRVKAAELLGQFRNPQALEALLHALDTTDRKFREVVTTSLSHLLIENPEKLTEMVKSIPETKTRKLGMAWLMGKTRKGDAIRFLINLLSDSEPDVRASAIGALGKFKRKNLRGHIGKLIYDPNERVRAAAVNAISGAGGDRAFEICKNAMEDVDEFVRRRGAIGLAKINRKKSIDFLQESSSKFPEVNSYLKGILLATGISYEDSVRNDTVAKSIVKEFCPEEEMLKDFKLSPDKDKRLHAFRVVALINGDNFRNLISLALKDPSPEIREEARRYHTE